MRVLVTGATGFVGRHLIPLLYKEHEVLCLVRDEDKAKALFGQEVKYLSTTDLSQVKLFAMTLGEQILDFVHVDDVAACLAYFVDNIELVVAKGVQEYHLGTGQGHSIRELASIIEKKYGKKANISWGARPYRPRDVMHAVAPIGNLLEIGFRTTRKIEDYV